MGATPERRRLIVNADDLGLSAGVNRGIIEAHSAGVVTSASVIVNLNAFPDAVRWAFAVPNLGTGLHFNIVLGRPLTRAPSLVNERTGEFLPLGLLARRAIRGRIVAGEVYAECIAQIARMRGAGLRVTHLDGHRHAHALPGVWPAVAHAAADSGIAFVRVPLEPLPLNPLDAAATAKKLALGASWHWAARGGLATRRVRFAGISLQGGRRFAARLLSLLRGLPAGVTELMVHPGHVDDELIAIDAYQSARETELAALTSRAVRDALDRFVLTHFGRV